MANNIFNPYWDTYLKNHFNLGKGRNASHFYHLCSKGTRRDQLFHNKQEFINGMNLVALSVSTCNIQMIAFCLMHNHFHFILAGKETEVKKFRSKIQQLYMFRRTKNQNAESIEKLEWGIFLISTLDYLKHSIAYVLNNPCDSFYTYLPTVYPWSTGTLYFNDPRLVKDSFKDTPAIGNFSSRSYRKILGTHTKMPAHWKLTADRYVWPGNYVLTELVEYIYGSHIFYLAYLIKKKENNLATQILDEAFR